MATGTPLPSNPLTGRLKVVLTLIGIAVFINYIDRGNLSIAAPMLKDELNLSGAQLGILLSAFFYTYAFLQPVAGWLVDRVNVKWVLAGGFLVWSAATAATGLVHAFAVLLLLRLTLGVGESIVCPACCKIIAIHFPEEHRGLGSSVITAGLSLGPGFGLLMGGMLVARFGWRSFFVALGLLSLIWLAPWIKYMPERSAGEPAAAAGAPSFFEFLRLRSAWGTCIGLLCFNYVNYFLITWLPYYLVRERHFSLQSMAKIGGAAYLLGAGFGLGSGWLSDRWVARGGTPTRVRKTFTAGGTLFCGIFVGLAALNGTFFCVAMLLMALIFFGVGSSNIWAVTQTLAGPQAAGRWTGFQNFIGNFAGIIGPAVTGVVLDRTGHLAWAFAITATVALMGTISWLFLVGPVVPVTWNKKVQADAVAI